MKFSRLYAGVLLVAATVVWLPARTDAQTCTPTANCELSQPGCLNTLAAAHAQFLLQQPNVQDPLLIKELQAQSQSSGKTLCAAAFSLVNQSSPGLKSVGNTILEQAVFHKSNLARVTFSGTDLKGASFNGSKLRGAIFSDVDLTNASFTPYTAGTVGPSSTRERGGELAPRRRGVFCSVTNQKNVNTDLEHAQFKGTILTGATFSCARMADVVFEPSALPDAAGMAYAQSLELLTYNEDPSPLIRLRQEFRDSGYSTQDNKITYAIRRRATALQRGSCGFRNMYSCLAYAGNKAAQISCGFGKAPLRPIGIGFFGWLFFASIYFAFMHHPGPSGLYLAEAEGIELEPGAIDKAPQVIRMPNGVRTGSWIAEELRLARVACFFSLINGFNLGFRDLDLSRWLHLLPRREFDFRAFGWPRTIAGIQALFTLAIVALFILILLGHPFD